ncbi:MAG: serine hydrolase domain-containing protein [Pseudomonadota bacterium]
MRQSTLSVLSNRSWVPKDLASVTTYDPAEEVDPESVGLTRKGVDAIWKTVENMYATGMHPGISFVLRRHGQVVLKRAIGHASGNGPGEVRNERKVLMRPDTPIVLFSACKAIAAMVVHLLSEKKLISLLDPVSHYIPEFGQNGKRDITIYQLLTHKGGIPTVDPGEHDPGDLLVDQDAVRHLIYATAPDKPGHHQVYHALTAGFVFADLVERVTGRPFRSVFRDWITRPLGLTRMDFGAPKKLRAQVARNYVTGFRVGGPANLYLQHVFGANLEDATGISNEDRFFEAVIPAGNGIGTADECARFFQCLLNGGELDGTRVFEPLTVRRAVVEVGKPEIDRGLLMPIRFSAGMMLGGKRFSLFGSDTEQAFGHLGFTSNTIWADPERDISVAFLNTGKLGIGLHVPHHVCMLRNISRYCPKLSEEEQGQRLLATGMC